MEIKKILVYIIFAITITSYAQKTSSVIDEKPEIENNKLYKKNAHASYYHDKFNGRKTASGKKFDNSKLTAAHKKLPFGTKLKITNEINNKSVIVEVTDRGPFVKGREIDLTKKAFMDITSNKSGGVVYVKIEIIEN
ncbi:septal ring lytic transglycosylase RlpA family protein [Flavobacterium sp. FlaQc-57]|uniref:septal ring lytic transglycosylase RlpA family protein n=1 Tax=Flavobacterium sp. FlaQc-57 TaxID=3374186 RepID=UPI003757C714